MDTLCILALNNYEKIPFNRNDTFRWKSICTMPNLYG